jgi:predicted HTH transcriptional regulator
MGNNFIIPESNEYEYKLILNSRFERSAVAFLNSSTGGAIYIGIKDDGTIAGVENPDELQMQISDRFRNNISPETLGLYDIIVKHTDDKSPLFYIKVIISSGTEKPYYIRQKGMTPEGCFIRIGSQIQSLTKQMIENLFARRTRSNLRVIEAPRQDLTFNQLKIYYEEHHKLLNNEFEKSLEFFTPSGKYNILAYLLADENGISIKVAKYKGKNKVNLIENEELGYCSLLKATDLVLNKLQLENKTFTKITSKFRKDKQLYDPVATREAVVNAFVHNDYTDLMTPVFELFDDRLEITSYGGLIDGMTTEELVRGISRPRNRELMRIYKDTDFVEQLGSGMNRMMKVYNPDIFNITPNFFQVIIGFGKAGIISGTINTDFDEKNQKFGIISGTISGKNTDFGTISGTISDKNSGFGTISGTIKITPVERQIYQQINSNPFITTEEIVVNTGIPLRSVARAIKSLREQGIIRREGSKKYGHWVII